MHRFLIIIEEGDRNLSAYSPDLPGCVATGTTREELEENMNQAIKMHIEGLEQDGLPIPEQKAIAEYVVLES